MDPILLRNAGQELELILSLMALVWIVIPVIVVNLKRKLGWSSLPIRRRFGLLDLFTTLISFAAVAVVLFFLTSGCGVGFSALLRLTEYASRNWFLASMHHAGWTDVSEQSLHQVRLFCSVVGAVCFAVPLSIGTGLGPKETDDITLASKFISFPARFSWSLGFRLKRSWSDLCAFESSSDQVKFRFRSGGQAVISRSDVPDETMNRLLQSVLEHAPQAVGLSDGDEDNLDVQPQSQSDGDYRSLTEFWNDDYRRHCRSTTFVPLAPQTVLQDRFTVLHQLASTAMSATYLARMQSGALVVLKESVASETQAGKKAKEHYLRECEHLCRLDHPRIAKVMDSFVEKGRCYLALQYIPGSDLNAQADQKKSMPQELVLDLAVQLCDILTYLHEQETPIIHRDISPHNLIVDAKQRLFLIDFGAANRFEANVTGTLIGKQSYIAPEQLRGKAVPQSDIYSLGATMFTLLTGKEPEALSVCSPHEALSAVSQDVSELVEACTQLEVENRIQSAAEVRQRIESITAGRNSGQKIKLPDLHRVKVSAAMPVKNESQA